jgi:uncharacterized protein YcnI
MQRLLSAGFGSVFVLTPGVALAHVSVTSGPAFANTTQEITFAVGHGCEGSDTTRVVIEIPAGVTSVRPETSDFGQVDVATDDAGTVVLVSWQKPEGAVLPTDTLFYKLLVRLKTPDAPFSTLYFPAHQTCRAADSTTKIVDWVGLDETDASVEPAPALRVVPARFPGWNKFTVAGAVTDLSFFFPDADIVWRDTSAYSINPTTMDLITATDGVSALDSLRAGDEIWVKY